MSYSRAIITGGAGFIGRRLAVALARRGKEVVVLTRRAITHDAVPGVAYVHLDIANRTEIPDAATRCAEADVLFHLAADVVWRTELSSDAYRAFTANVSNLFLLLARLGSVRRVVLGSSIMVYPMVGEAPFVEDRDEDPPNFYGVHKLTLERCLAVWSRAERLSSISIRIGQTYGPGMRVNRFLPDTLKAAVGNEPIVLFGEGSQAVDWVHVDDVVEGLLLAADSACTGSINVASGRAVSNRELAERIVRVTGSHSVITCDPSKTVPPRRQVIDIGKASRELGYSPRFDIDSGVAAMLSELAVPATGGRA